MLHMTARVIFGPLKYPGYTGDSHGHGHDSHSHAGAHGHGDHHAEASDIGAREIGLLLPLVAVVLILGIKPNIILKTIEGPLKLIQNPVAAVVEAPQPQAVATAVSTSADTQTNAR